METILVVEDDELLLGGIGYALKKEGFEVLYAASLKEAREVSLGKADLVVLDLNLPDGDGREFLRGIRRNSETPVLVLTAKDEEQDAVESFQLGCDDYVTKPFSMAVLLGHIRAVLKRSRGKEDKNIYKGGGICYHFLKKELTRQGREVRLTATETRLLELFLKNRNQVLTREVILERVWDTFDNYVDDRTLNVNIRRLREKIEEDAGHPALIVTVFGIGYKWKDAMG